MYAHLLLLLFSCSVMSASLRLPWTVARQAPLSAGFSRQEHWSGLPFPSAGVFLPQGSHPGLLHCRQITCNLCYHWTPREAPKYICVCLCVYMCVCVCMYVCIYKHMCKHICPIYICLMHIPTYTNTQICIQYMHTYYICVYLYVCTHAINICVHI